MQRLRNEVYVTMIFAVESNVLFLSRAASNTGVFFQLNDLNGESCLFVTDPTKLEFLHYYTRVLEH